VVKEQQKGGKQRLTCLVPTLNPSTLVSAKMSVRGGLSEKHAISRTRKMKGRVTYLSRFCVNSLTINRSGRLGEFSMRLCKLKEVRVGLKSVVVVDYTF
jgi:hypothetical protein